MAKIETIRHSLSHIMAAAVQELFPKVKFGIGPAIENGFYYDFGLSKSLSPEDLPKIEKKMQAMIKNGVSFNKKQVSKKEAKKIFKGQPYKLELIKEVKEKNVTIYQSNGFIDLCKGPHIKSSKEIDPKSFKLNKIAGAYWKGSEKNPMLQRVYVLAFNSKKELNEFLKKETEAEKRDHRKLGKKLELFMIDQELGQGLPLWLPKGAILRKIVMDFALNTYLNRGYQLVATPHIANLKLWKRSGHTDFYKEGMFPPMHMREIAKEEKDDYQLKPMNCLGHVKIYDSKIRSYKNLPLRFTEMGTVYRYERSGTLHGLMRVRGFTQDDAHIFCTPEQLHSELLEMIDLTLYILRSFGFKKFEISLSVRDIKERKKYLGDDKSWKLAEKALENALKAKKLSYTRYVGEAVFYGPKIDFLVSDAIGRKWQLTTIQVDFNFPEKFDLNYIDKKGKKKRPIMLHRALLGALERFIGVLIEHYEGAFPLWLSPIQLMIIPVGSTHISFAEKIAKSLREQNFRVIIKDETETVSKKIREGEIQKIPYLLVVGDKEMKSQSVRVRKRGKGDIGMMKLSKFLKKIKIEQELKK